MAKINSASLDPFIDLAVHLQPFRKWHLTLNNFNALILGVLIARWFWILCAPHTTYLTTLPKQGSGLESGNIMGLAAPNETAKQKIALPNVKLLGIYAPNQGRPGFAIFELQDKQQIGVELGGEVTTGIKLITIRSDHALLRVATEEYRINIEAKTAP